MASTRRVEERMGDLLLERGERISTAESCTGGLVSSIITDVPGSSQYFAGGIVSYSPSVKLHELAVSRESLDQHGEVSEPVAQEMAQRIRDIAETTWSVSTTGYAGPAGGDERDPVGTVYIGVAYAGKLGSGTTHTTVGRFHFQGERHHVKEQIAEQALEFVISEIEDLEQR